MKKFSIKNKIIILFLGICISQTQISSAQWITSDLIGHIQDAIESTAQIAGQAMEYVQDGMTLYQTAKNTAATIQNLKNLSLKDIASNVTVDAMLNIGDAVTKSIGVTSGSSNPLTNGQGVVTNVSAFINKNGTNAIRATISKTSTASANNPYIDSANKQIIQNLRSSNSDSITMRLPYIAQDEICNSSDLKNVIKNGRKATWFKSAKPAVKNIDIDALCNVNLDDTNDYASSSNVDKYNVSNWTLPINKTSGNTSDISNLQSFLIDRGYLNKEDQNKSFLDGVYDTIVVEAVKQYQKDSDLDQSGEIDTLTAQEIAKDSQDNNKSITPKEAQVAFISLAQAGYGGSKTAIALTDPSNTPNGVLSSLTNKVQSAFNTAEDYAKNQLLQNGGVVGTQKCMDKNGKEIKYDPTKDSSSTCDHFETTAAGSAAVLQANLQAARLSPYFSMLNSTLAQSKNCSGAHTVANYGSADATMDGVMKFSCSLNKFTNIINSILGSIITDDSSKAQLATSLSAITSSDTAYNQLLSNQEKQDQTYQSGGNYTNNYTVDDIPEILNTYEQIRNINTQRLNEEAYTYVMASTTYNIYAQTGALATYGQVYDNDYAGWIKDKNCYSINGDHPGDCIKAIQTAYDNIVDIKNLSKVFNVLLPDIKSLISTMAKNNYTEQQVRRLQERLNSDGFDINNATNSVIIKNILSQAISQAEYQDIINAWNFTTSGGATSNIFNSIDLSLLKSELTSPYPQSSLSIMRSQFYVLKTASLTNFRLSQERAINGGFTSSEARGVIHYAIQGGGADSSKAHSLFEKDYGSNTGESISYSLPIASFSSFQSRGNNYSLLKAYGISSVDDISSDIPTSYSAKVSSANSANYDEAKYCSVFKLFTCNR